MFCEICFLIFYDFCLDKLQPCQVYGVDQEALALWSSCQLLSACMLFPQPKGTQLCQAYCSLCLECHSIAQKGGNNSYPKAVFQWRKIFIYLSRNLLDKLSHFYTKKALMREIIFNTFQKASLCVKQTDACWNEVMDILSVWSTVNNQFHSFFKVLYRVKLIKIR